MPAHVQPRGGGIWLSEAGESRDLPRSGRRLPWEGAAQMEAARQGGAGGRMQSRSHGTGLMWPYLARQRQFHGVPSGMGGHSGNSKISSRVFRIFEISGFDNYCPKFAPNNRTRHFEYPKIRVRVRVIPELPDFFKLIASKLKAT